MKRESDLLWLRPESDARRSYDELGPSAMTRSGSRHRTPSPISEIENPIASVLEGMRVQRMSLVQSLRQYLFVHRGESSRIPLTLALPS